MLGLVGLVCLVALAGIGLQGGGVALVGRWVLAHRGLLVGNRLGEREKVEERKTRKRRGT